MQNYQSWKNYQKGLQRKGLYRRLLRQGFWFLPCLLLLVLATQFFKVELSTGSFIRSPELGMPFKEKAVETSKVLMKKDLRGLIDPEVLCNCPDGKIHLSFSGNSFSTKTTLDSSFQAYMSGKIHGSKSPLVGFVAMDPSSGRILCMVDSKKIKGAESVCLSSQFPAASIFKIVSAAAAIDRCNMSADTKLTYNGRKHTLYKNQLTDRTNRYTNSVSLKASFAESINPTFGKLGISYLKKDILQEYAVRFGFNQPIDFELPLQPSRISVDDDPYHWAELACGFNRETLISPVHGAMMAAAILNDGKLVEPTIIEVITDSENKPVYSGNTRVIRQVVSPKVSQEMKKLMAATLSRGTSRRAFRGFRHDRHLKNLIIGGKTGSIKNKSDELFYDWFVGFCTEKTGTRKLALAVLVVHDKLLRARAQEYACLAMRYYFKKPSSS